MSDETKTIGALTLAARMKELVEALFSLPPEMREHAVDALGELIARRSRMQAHEDADEIRRGLLSMLTPVFLDYAKSLVASRSEPDLPPPPEVIDPGAVPTNNVFDLLLSLTEEQRTSIRAILTPTQLEKLRATGIIGLGL